MSLAFLKQCCEMFLGLSHPNNPICFSYISSFGIVLVDPAARHSVGTISVCEFHLVCNGFQGLEIHVNTFLTRYGYSGAARISVRRNPLGGRRRRGPPRRRRIFENSQKVSLENCKKCIIVAYFSKN